MTSARDGRLDLATLLRGGVAGLATLLAGFVVTYAWKAPAVDDALSGVNAIAQVLGGQAIPTWKAVGWLYLNAHLVATRVPTLGGGDRLVNFIDASDDGSLVLLYVLVPLLLVAAGAVVAGGDRDRLGDAAAAGATVVVGYLPAAVGLAIVAGHTFGGQVTIAPDPGTAVTVAGGIYPVVFGAIGGGLRGWLESRTG